GGVGRISSSGRENVFGTWPESSATSVQFRPNTQLGSHFQLLTSTLPSNWWHGNNLSFRSSLKTLIRMGNTKLEVLIVIQQPGREPQFRGCHLHIYRIQWS